VSADIVQEAPVQRRLLSRHIRALDLPSQSRPTDDVDEDTSFVDDTDVPVHATVPSSQTTAAVAPSQEAGQAGLVHIVSAKACADDLQATSPCDSFLEQVVLDSNNAYQCFVHLDSSALDLAKATDASCFQYKSFDLTNGTHIPILCLILCCPRKITPV
jgi:hypothetical protein